MYRLRFIHTILLILSLVVLITVIPIILLLKTTIPEVSTNQESIRILTERILIITFYSLFISFIMALFVSRSITMPLLLLKKAAKRVGGGEFDMEITYRGIDEFGEIIKAFNEMAKELKKKTDTIEDRNKELSLLNDIASILTRTLRTDEIFNAVIERLKERYGMDGGGIFIIDGESLICKYHSGVSEEFVQQAGRIHIGHDIPGMVAQHGQAITCVDVSIDPRLERSILRDSGIKGYCCIPLKGKEKVIGVFCIFRFKPYEWRQDDEKILNSIGEMLGLAFENISLYERTALLYNTLKHNRQRELENLSIMVDILSEMRGLDELINNALVFIRERFAIDFAGLMSLDTGGGITLSGISPPHDGLFPHSTIYEGDVNSQESLSMKEGVIIEVDDLRQESRFYYHDAIKHNYLSSLTIPILSGERVIGCLSLYSKRARRFTDEEIHFLKIFSTVLGLSIERSEFYEDIIKQEALSTAILDSIEDGVYTVDRDGHIISLNRAAEEMTGLKRERLRGKRCEDIILHGSRSVFCKIDECPLTVALSGSPLTTEIEYIKPEGKKVILQTSCFPLRDPIINEVTGATVVLRDITDQKELDRIKTEMIKFVSHEFRTPLTSIVGMTEMLLNDDVRGERAKEYLNIMQREGLRLSRMTRELLDISRLEKMDFCKMDLVDFEKVIESIKGGFSGIIKTKDATMNLEIEGEVTGFIGDEARIEQALRNLIDNSLTYSDRGVRVDITIRAVDEMLEITVKDTGWGIPEEDIPHLGEKFYRGRHGRMTKGTGLGLSIVKEIVKLHKGRFSIESEMGKGSSFHIMLPLKKERAVQ